MPETVFAFDNDGARLMAYQPVPPSCLNGHAIDGPVGVEFNSFHLIPRIVIEYLCGQPTQDHNGLRGVPMAVNRENGAGFKGIQHPLGKVRFGVSEVVMLPQTRGTASLLRKGVEKGFVNIHMMRRKWSGFSSLAWREWRNVEVRLSG